MKNQVHHLFGSARWFNASVAAKQSGEKVDQSANIVCELTVIVWIDG